MKVAFFGTGLMGAPMAQRLMSDGHELMTYNRTPGKAKELLEEGAQYTDQPLEALAFCEAAITMLSDAAAIEDVLLSDTAAIHLKGKLIIQMGTIAPEESKAIMAKIEELGGEYMECPVLGSIPEARKGTLLLMVGATEEQFDKYRGILSSFGEQPLYIGSVGHAATVKLAMNQLIASLTTAFSLSLGLVQRQGVDVDKFMSICRDSALYAPTYDKKLGKYLGRDFEGANFPVKHMLKDVKLFQQAASDAGLNDAILTGVAALLEETVSMGQSDFDYSAVYNAVNPAS